jgi:plastocyanin
MFVHTRSILLLIALLLVSSVVSAATFNVTVGGNANAFSPSTLTIQAGDTVTWTNAGGFHNVAANDSSFRNGDPSSSTWTFSHTFGASGTTSYHCEVHGGMTGSITVQAVTPPPPPTIKLGGYLSGNWYDPSLNQAGHGFQLEFTNAPGVTAGNKVLVAIWFVFTPDGNPQWVYGQGEWNPNTNTATIPAEIYTGAKFPPNYNFNDRQQLTFPPGWGTMTFTFSGCNDGTASWDPSPTALGMGYGSGTLPLKRLTQIDGTTCPQ